jgi:hypothetical protein
LAEMMAMALAHPKIVPKIIIFPSRGSNGIFARMLPKDVNSPWLSKQFNSKVV